jgi:hypothetical protein
MTIYGRVVLGHIPFRRHLFFDKTPYDTEIVIFEFYRALPPLDSILDPIEHGAPF